MDIKRHPVDLEKYATFFQYAITPDCALGVVSENAPHKLLACSGLPEDFEKRIGFVEEKSGVLGDFLKKDGLQFADAETIGSLVKARLKLPEGVTSPWLVGFVDNKPSDIDESHRANILKLLSYIAQRVIDDYVTQKTLTDTINELTVRYEELNLLYGLDDVDSHRIQLDEKQALTQIIANCCDYLNVDLALIHVPKLNLTLTKSNTGAGLPCLQHDLIYRQIVSSQTTLVANKARDSFRGDFACPEPVKFIAAPIKMDKQNIEGVLVIANTIQKPDFSNSDRKLADVLAAEAGKLIQARRDGVTGLLNRRGFSEKLHQVLDKIRVDGTAYSLFFIDIDQFKIVNESAGQKGGDQLLNHIASIINGTLDNVFAIGRLGADEYGVILANCNLEQAEQKAEQLSQNINQFRYSYHNKLFDISVCIGLVELQATFDDYFTPLSLANLACNVAKEKGRSRVHAYHPSDKDMLRHETDIQWVSRINLALEEQRFRLYRQKLQPLQKENPTEEHYEILIRLIDEEGKLITPFAFIPAAERYNLMPKLDRWVVASTLAKMREIMAKPGATRLFCSINLSGQSFTDPGFAEFLIELVTNSGVPPECICFEITETAAVSNMTQTVKFLETLKKIGCFFSLDDFGSGMSSFTYLKNLPVDYLKIDGYFVKTMITNEIDFAMVKSIHDIGHVMGLKTVAEFVEDDQIKSALASLGVDYGQGYGIAKPEPFE